jgi:hypothetical protein
MIIHNATLTHRLHKHHYLGKGKAVRAGDSGITISGDIEVDGVPYGPSHPENCPYPVPFTGDCTGKGKGKAVRAGNSGITASGDMVVDGVPYGPSHPENCPYPAPFTGDCTGKGKGKAVRAGDSGITASGDMVVDGVPYGPSHPENCPYPAPFTGDCTGKCKFNMLICTHIMFVHIYLNVRKCRRFKCLYICTNFNEFSLEVVTIYEKDLKVIYHNTI